MVTLRSAYSGRKVLVTGGYGFKGSWLVAWLKHMGAEVEVYSLINQNSAHYFYLFGDTMEARDIRDRDLLESVIADFQPEIIFHLAAQPIVIESYLDPYNTFTSNVMGTVNLLDAASRARSVKAVVNITTDKVYENTESLFGYREDDRLGGYDPYAVSKVCSDMISSCYNKAVYNGKILVAQCRAGNVIGGGDFGAYRLIPDIMRAKYSRQKLTVRHVGACRPFTYILDIIRGYLMVGEKLLSCERKYATCFNLSTDEEIPVKKVLDYLSVDYDVVMTEHIETSRLVLDSTRARNWLPWKPQFTIEQMLDFTGSWYTYLYETSNVITMEQVKLYEDFIGDQG